MPYNIIFGREANFPTKLSNYKRKDSRHRDGLHCPEL